GDERIAERGMVAVEDRLEERAIDLAAMARAPFGQPLPALFQRGRTTPRPDEAVQHQALDVLGTRLGEGSGTQASAGLPEYRRGRAPAFRAHDGPRCLEVADGIGDIGIARRARRAAVAVV